MSWNGKNASKNAVQERGFTLEVEGRTVPGVYWTPEEGVSDRLVLLGHGGTTHKKIEYIEQLAALLVARGFSAMAIDGMSFRVCGATGVAPNLLLLIGRRRSTLSKLRLVSGRAPGGACRWAP